MAEARRKCGKAARARRAQRFAAEANKAFAALNVFVRTYCGRRRDEATDALCEIVDTYVGLHCRILAWCRRNNVPVRGFLGDVLGDTAADYKPPEAERS